MPASWSTLGNSDPRSLWMAFLVRFRIYSINPHMWNGPRCNDAFQSISSNEDGAVICPAYLCGHYRWPR